MIENRAKFPSFSNQRKVEVKPPVETNKEKAIPDDLLYPNADDLRFRNQDGFHRRRTVFSAPSYEECSQRGEVAYLNSNDFVGSKSDQAWEVAGNSGFIENSAAFFEACLREFFRDSDLELVHISTGVDRATSETYRIFGFVVTRF